MTSDVPPLEIVVRTFGGSGFVEGSFAQSTKVVASAARSGVSARARTDRKRSTPHRVRANASGGAFTARNRSR